MKKFVRRMCCTSLLAVTSLSALAQGLPADINGLPPGPTPASAQPSLIPSAPDVNTKAYVLMDVNSGTIIAEKDMNERMPPASLTKLMSLFLTSQALKSGAVKANDEVLVTNEAWQTGGSRMFIKPGTRIPLSLLIQGIIVASGNDATMAVAQQVGGSVDTFVDMMNQQAQLLGMKNSHFTDPTGLPEPTHYTTAYDLALLSRAIWLDFPEFRDWYKQKWLVFNGIKQPNRDRLLWRYPYAVGMKTGHTDEAGYCLVGMAVNQGMTLVAVVLNSPSDEERANNAMRLLSYGFRFYSSHLIYQAGKTILEPRIWYGSSRSIPAGTLYDVYLTTPQNGMNDAQVAIKVDPMLKAPIKKGQTIGSVNVILSGKIIASYPLTALADDSRGGIFRSFIDSIELSISKWFKKQDKPLIFSINKNTRGGTVNGADTVTLQPLSVAH